MRLRPVGLVAALLAALLFSLVGVPAQANDDARRKQQLDREIVVLQGDADEVTASYLAAVLKLQVLEARLPAARDAVAQARGALAAAQAHEAAVSDQLQVAVAEADKAGRELDAVRLRIAASQLRLGELATAAYQGGGNTLTLYLDARSVADMMRSMAYTQSAAQVQNALLTSLTNDRADLAAKAADAVARRDQVVALRLQAEAIVSRQTQLALAATAATNHLNELVAAAAAGAHDLAVQKAAILAQMQQMQAESARIGAILVERARQARIAAAKAAAKRAAAKAAAEKAARAAALRRHQTFRPSPAAPPPAQHGVGGFLSRPTDGRISSPFGMRVHPITGVYKLHDGTDFASPCGTPIHAAAPGVVIEAAYQGAWGNRVIIDHGLVGGHGLATGYNHMTHSIVSAGQSVARGQVVGYVGTTGLSTGCHLHFHVFLDGVPVDPMRYL